VYASAFGARSGRGHEYPRVSRGTHFFDCHDAHTALSTKAVQSVFSSTQGLTGCADRTRPSSRVPQYWDGKEADTGQNQGARLRNDVRNTETLAEDQIELHHRLPIQNLSPERVPV
jgi:hypothetical protein